MLCLRLNVKRLREWLSSVRRSAIQLVEMSPASLLRHPITYVCFAAFVASSIIAWTVFEAVPHIEDEHAYLFQARLFAHGKVYRDLPPEPASFFVPFVVEVDGRQFSKYPPGYSLLLSVGVALHQGWAVNAVASAAVLLATYGLAHVLYARGGGHTTGLLAASIGLASPMFVLLSGSLMSHPTSSAALLGSIWLLMHVRMEPSRHPIVEMLVSGSLFGLAFIIRPWTAFGIGIPFVALAIHDIQHRNQSPKVFIVWIAACILVAVIWPLHNWIAAGSPLVNTYRLWWSYDTFGFGSGLGSRGSHTPTEALSNLRFALPSLTETLTGWPTKGNLSPTWLVMVLCLFVRPRHWADWALLIPPASLVLCYLAYWTIDTTVYGPRYYAEAMPFLWIVIARGLYKFALGGKRWRRWMYLGLVLCTAWSISVVIPRRSEQGRGSHGITRRDAETVLAARIQGALVFVKSRDWADYASLSWLNESDLESASVVYAEYRDTVANTNVLRAFSGRSVYVYDRFCATPLQVLTDLSAFRYRCDP